MLTINNLSLSFNEKIVLDNLNLSIHNSSIYGILGKNGAGKTSLFECLFQTYKYSGQILLNDRKITRKEISYLETENYFYPYITGKEYLSYFSESKHDYIDLVSKFNLPLEKYIENYSSGMKKKIALIGNLILDKPILILDEPFNGVDFEGVIMLYDLIKLLKKKNKIVIISSHIIETLFNTCDEIGVLNDGKIENQFSKNEFEKLQNFAF
ncbi:ATP-binding cassette domain-containing protein [Riemerella columbina]|uniref:ATP-binding cassette domain-containing protein n=1 Tax=Riemerella columbina TaxID=103810 RepID=UPI0003733C61|nr:ATP-binding cassette domain-containing protein [Riemerella columbina]